MLGVFLWEAEVILSDGRILFWEAGVILPHGRTVLSDRTIRPDWRT